MIRNAIISVHNKSKLLPLAKFLLKNNVKIYSSGGTFKHLKELNHKNVIDITSLTNSPEMLDGRVKTLHPKIHGGILAKNTMEHKYELEKYGIPSFDLVVCNLYPFQDIINEKNSTENDIIENIDIGGHTLIRAAAKNYDRVLTIVDPEDYNFVTNNFDSINEHNKKNYAAKAFNHAMQYDVAINGYFNPDIMTKSYVKEFDLKYGLNPQQKNAGVYKNTDHKSLPFKVLNGNPGYINFLDAIYGYGLVNELGKTLGMVACASYKHTSPAGVGLGTPLSQLLQKVYMINKNLSPQASAFIKARNADPLCSFGDFVAINDVVDVCMAEILVGYVSDGIVALGYEDGALEILKKKKKGTYIILKAENFENSGTEMRELHGITLVQESNKQVTTFNSLSNIVTENKELSTQAKIDLILANTTCKYTQSNTIVAALNGQVIGVGAGQQSRVDCMKLVKRKALNWYARQHPKCIEYLYSLKSMTNQERINNVMKCVEEYPFIHEEKLTNVAIASDAFIPFTDNIDVANEFGCRYIIQPGGSVADNDIIRECDKQKIVQCITGKNMRMFLH